MTLKKGSFVIEGLENVQINIGKVGAGEEQIAEGPTPRPEIIGLRNWDFASLTDIIRYILRRQIHVIIAHMANATLQGIRRVHAVLTWRDNQRGRLF